MANFDLGIDWDQWDFNPDQVDDSIDQFIKSTKAKNTEYKEVSDLKRFYVFLKQRNSEEVREIENIPEAELDEMLCIFYIQARKYMKETGTYDGDLYQPDTHQFEIHCNVYCQKEDVNMTYVYHPCLLDQGKF